MAKPQHIRHYTKVSGSQLGKNAKKITGCESCNFMEMKKPEHKTGAQCPRCGNPTLRVFDSQAEFQRACELRLLRDKGLISDLSFQVRYPLTVYPNDTIDGTDGHNSGEAQHLCFYIADFTYRDLSKAADGDGFVVEDVKNKSMVVTEIALHKMKHFELQYGIPVTIVGR